MSADGLADGALSRWACAAWAGATCGSTTVAGEAAAAATLAIPPLAYPAALLVGLSLGLLGSGGSILAVPLLHTVVGLPFDVSRVTAFPIVGASALAALLAALRADGRAGRAHVLRAWPFAAASVPASFVASRSLAPLVPELPQTLLFTALMLVAAWRMARRPAREGAVERRRSTASVVAAGALAGTLTGLLGVGGGFVIVPALVLTLGFDVRSAVATSLLLIAANCAAGLLADALGPRTPVRWDVATVFSAAGVAGALAGRRVSARLSPVRLRRTFAAVVLVAAVAMLVRAL